MISRSISVAGEDSYPKKKQAAHEEVWVPMFVFAFSCS